MSQNDSFAELMARLRAGDEDAATQVFARFASRLVGLARRLLQGGLRQKVDPEDVLQSVCKSFFIRHRQGLLELKNWDSIWGILTLITARKCAKWTEKFHAQKRAVQVEV